MLATEFFYRGFLMMGTKESIGRWSILLQAIPYAYVHLGKPMLEVYYSFFAGIAFGYVDYESRSIFPSFFLHWTTSIIFDILCTL
jgi:membrane protease YdiL (CAAX protease family)